MATLALGAVGSLFPGAGTAIGAAIGSVIDQQFLFPVLFPADQPPPRAADLPAAVSIEGGKANIILGQSARVPLPLMWASAAQEDTRTTSFGKRGETATTQWLRNLQCHTAIGATYPWQMIADGRRIWSQPLTLDITTTLRSSVSLADGVYGYIVGNLLGVYYGDVRIFLYPTHAAGGPPHAGSPDLAAFDEGGTVTVTVGGSVASGAAWWSSDWTVERSRVIDSFGVSELVLVQQLYSTPGVPIPTYVPPSWSSFVTLSGVFYHFNDGVSLVLNHTRVDADLKVFPLGWGSVDNADGTFKPALLTTRLANVPYLRQSANAAIASFNTSSFGNRIPNLEMICSGFVTSVAEVVDQITVDGLGLDQVECNTEQLSGLEQVMGLRVFAPSRAGTILDQLATIHYLYWHEGWNGTSLGRWTRGYYRDNVYIAAGDANCRLPGSEFDAIDIDLRVLNTDDRPESVSVAYSNRDNAWQRGTATWNANTSTPTGQSVSVQLIDATLTPTRAQEIADRVGMQAWSRIREATLSPIPWAFATMQTDDFVVFTSSDGSTYDVLVQKVDFDSGNRAIVSGYVVDRDAFLAPDPSALTPTAEDIGVEDGLRSRSGRLYLTGIAEEALSHCPIVGRAVELGPLRDEHIGIPGVYVYASTANRSLIFGGAVVLMQREGSDCWTIAAVLRSAATVGFTLEALASGTGYDLTNTVDVRMQFGEPESTTSDLCGDSANRYLIGSEVVGVVTSTPGTDPDYEFSDLHRGMLDTTAAAATHVAFEPVALLDDSIAFVPVSVEDIGTTVLFAFVPPGLTVDDVTPVPVAVTGKTCTPLAPADVLLADISGTLRATWTYRSLRNARFLTPAQDPREAGDRVVLQFWNSTLAGISGDPDYEVEVDVLDDSLTLPDPGGLGLEGPDVCVRIFARSTQWGDGAVGEDELSATYSAVTPVDVESFHEHSLSGSETGSTTSVALRTAGNTVISSSLGVPVSVACSAAYVAISIAHGTPGAGTWTATLHRIRSGAESAVATFTFDL